MWEVFLLSIFIIFIIWAFVELIGQSNKHKAFIGELNPSRLLSKEELDAINYLDVDKPTLELLRPRLPKSKRDKSVYCFSNCTLTLQDRQANRGGIVYFFYISVDDEYVEVLVPTYFVEYLKIDHRKTYNISCVSRNATFVLVEIEGMISYPQVHNSFRLKDVFIPNSISKRMAKKEEEKLFLFSKWASVWITVSLVACPLLFLMFFEEPGFFLFMTPMWLPLAIFSYFSYKKRKKYMESSLTLYRIQGTLKYDKEMYTYYIDKLKLRLPYGWDKYIKEHFSVSDKIEIEAFLHSYDTLNEEIIKSLQPIYIQSHTKRIDHKKVPVVRSIWIPLLTFLFTASMVFGMHSDKFIPYTYHAFNTHSTEYYFYSSDGFMQSEIKERQYVETVGLALPILSKEESFSFGYDTVATDENYIFFPQDIAQSILNYPKLPKEFPEVITIYRGMKFKMETLKRCNGYKNDKSYMNYCMRTTLDDLRASEPLFKPFKTYETFLKETNFQSFKALEKELFIHYKEELYTFYNALEPLLKEGTTYRRYPQNSNYTPNGFYENMEYLNTLFAYLEAFPKTETLAGIVSDTDKKVWHVNEDNYDYVFYTVFLTLFWLLSLLLMLYTFWVLAMRIRGFLRIFFNGRRNK